jgi:hypothetical protein
LDGSIIVYIFLHVRKEAKVLVLFLFYAKFNNAIKI